MLTAREIGEFIRIVDVVEADGTQVVLTFLDLLFPLDARQSANLSAHLLALLRLRTLQNS